MFLRFGFAPFWPLQVMETRPPCQTHSWCFVLLVDATFAAAWIVFWCSNRWTKDHLLAEWGWTNRKGWRELGSIQSWCLCSNWRCWVYLNPVLQAHSCFNVESPCVWCWTWGLQVSWNSTGPCECRTVALIYLDSWRVCSGWFVPRKSVTLVRWFFRRHTDFPVHSASLSVCLSTKKLFNCYG